MTGRSPFGSFSAFRYLDGGNRFMGVSDRGYWYFGTMQRDARGRPNGVVDFSMEEIARPPEQANSTRKLDAEGLAVAGDIATASFEREHRVSQYKIERGQMGAATRDLDILIPRNELRRNQSLETTLASPKAGPFAGAILLVSEMSLNADGNMFASVLSGPRKGIFFVKRSDDFAITDGAFLPNGDILILERRFSYAQGVAMRIRRLSAKDIQPGQTVDGPILLFADMGFQIDNMEGMDVWRASDGTTRVALVSDDNQSIFQRNLYLEFVYTAE